MAFLMTTACSRIVSIVLTAAGESLIAMSGGVDSSVAALLTYRIEAMTTLDAP